MNSHRIRVLGRELLVKSEAPPEKVREVEAFVNDKISEVAASVKGGDPQIVAVLALLNIAEAYLDLFSKYEVSKRQEEKLSDLLQRIDDVVEKG
ncbi:cell division protein ZapA [Geobacter sp. DSM 9736]|uniref:cell division protein ZapA n=1 Tax=Geobacter sp. DSM 9736 TaxID=1277350 RepID=UPI000B506029|nr:cell division protein ZapA [Geobacter sp. DSM 9736]SNB46339.1 cell division protein ZapA [Geobacter sp. DSM 9736]